MPLSVKIAPSLLSGDFANLAHEAQTMIDFGSDYLHMDVMDGHFVPNLTIGAPVIQCLRRHTSAFLDCHLMVSNPEQWINDFAKAGASLFMFHIEAAKGDPLTLIRRIHETGMKAGLAVKPKTMIESVLPFAAAVDMILIMTVEPGFGGQKFMPHCLEKVTVLREKFPSLDIQVDGGLSMENIGLAAQAGANVFVAGSAIFGSVSPKETIASMREVAVRSLKR